MSELQWHPVASVSAVTEETPISVEINGNPVGIFRVDNQYYAIEDVCPHAFALLSEGFVEGCQVECPLHEAIFDLTTGKCLGGPSDRDVATYPVKVEGEQILVEA